MRSRALFFPSLIALTACTARFLDVETGDGGAGSGVDAAPVGCDVTDGGSDLCGESAYTGLSAATQSNIVLWLDPSNLPPVGSRFTVWPDRSAHHNDGQATATDPATLPFVLPGSVESTPGGVELLHGDSTSGFVGGPFRIPTNGSFDLGTDDFVMLTSWNATDATPGLCFFGKQPGSPTDVGGKLLFTYSFGDGGGAPGAQINSRTPQILGPAGLLGPRTYTLLRTGTQLEMRVDGTSGGTATDPTIGTSVTSTADVFIGACSSLGAGTTGGAMQNMSAFILVHGAVPAPDLSLLESFMRKVPSDH